jgi:uncharacterized membrane protein YfcA
LSTTLVALALGFAAGALSGMFGVGGGMLFVPTLVIVLGEGQVGAQATSLAAMIPVVLAGSWRHHRLRNVRWRVALVVGAASAAGVAGGAALAVNLPEDLLRKLFAGLLLLVALRLVWSRAREG